MNKGWQRHVCVQVTWEERNGGKKTRGTRVLVTARLRACSDFNEVCVCGSRECMCVCLCMCMCMCGRGRECADFNGVCVHRLVGVCVCVGVGGGGGVGVYSNNP